MIFSDTFDFSSLDTSMHMPDAFHSFDVFTTPDAFHSLDSFDPLGLSDPLSTHEPYGTLLDDIEQFYLPHPTEHLDIHSYDPSFGSAPVNMYDRNTADFLDQCQRLDIDLPRSVNHDPNGGISVDRSYDGGLLSIDKSIIRDTLDKVHESGRLTDSQYDQLVNKLRNC